MKFLVTFVPISKSTRRRTGKAQTVVIDSTERKGFFGLSTPSDVERRFESLNRRSAKVVDVREV